MKATRYKINTYKWVMISLLIAAFLSCKKEEVKEEAKIIPPVRTYMITARIDKKGTNSNSDGTGILKGTYNEEDKLLTYALEYENITPTLITLRSGPKGTAGEMIREIFKNTGTVPAPQLKGSLNLSPLQERNLLKGYWFVAISTQTATPEISGTLTLKQN